MIPLRDDVRSSSRPFVTYVILAVNIVVYIYEIALGKNLADFIWQFGAVPYDLFHPTGFDPYIRLFTSMFMHSSLMHIIGNMLFLWVFSDNVEDRLGHFKYVIFYLLSGICGAMLHGLISPNSKIPMIGASGAISGIMGAYIYLYPKAKILALIPLGFFMRATYLPALAFLGLWFLYQLLLGLLTVGAGGGGVAYFAHIGGFAAGLLFSLPFKRKGSKKLDYDVF